MSTLKRYSRTNLHEKQERERLRLLLKLVPQIADGKTCLYPGDGPQSCIVAWKESQ